MRLPAAIVMGVVLVAGSGCARDNTPGDGRPAAATAPEVVASMDSASTDRVPADSVPPGAAGKISADQVGKLSPVPAFQGGGADWSIEIHSLGDLRHSVKLASGDEVQTGTAVYQPTTSAQPQILLTGTLYARSDDHALRITLRRDACRDAAGRAHQHRVRVEIAGAPPLLGCGDLAMY